MWYGWIKVNDEMIGWKLKGSLNQSGFCIELLDVHLWVNDGVWHWKFYNLRLQKYWYLKFQTDNQWRDLDLAANDISGSSHIEEWTVTEFKSRLVNQQPLKQRLKNMEK